MKNGWLVLAMWCFASTKYFIASSLKFFSTSRESKLGCDLGALNTHFYRVRKIFISDHTLNSILVYISIILIIRRLPFPLFFLCVNCHSLKVLRCVSVYWARPSTVGPSGTTPKTDSVIPYIQWYTLLIARCFSQNDFGSNNAEKFDVYSILGI